jgi:hypothetical protein
MRPEAEREVFRALATMASFVASRDDATEEVKRAALTIGALVPPDTTPAPLPPRRGTARGRLARGI